MLHITKLFHEYIKSVVQYNDWLFRYPPPYFYSKHFGDWTLPLSSKEATQLLAPHAYEGGHKICWKEAKVLQVEQTITYRKYKKSAHMSLVAHPMCQSSLDTSPMWTQSLMTKLENYNSIQFRLCGNVPFLCWYYTGVSFNYRYWFICC
jgi:hypothetical protein